MTGAANGTGLWHPETPRRLIDGLETGLQSLMGQARKLKARGWEDLQPGSGSSKR